MAVIILLFQEWLFFRDMFYRIYKLAASVSVLLASFNETVVREKHQV